MAVRYNRLFYLMIDRKMTNAQLAEKAGVSLNIITRLKKDEYLSMETLEKLCAAMKCTPNDVLEFVPDDPASKKQGE